MYNEYINHICDRKALAVPFNKPKDNENLRNTF